MKIKIIKCLQDNYSYLIVDEDEGIACVIDPSEAKPVINYIEKNNLKLAYILNTHHHFDHVGGNLELKTKYNSKVVGFKGDKDRIPEIDILLESGVPGDSSEVELIPVDGEIRWGRLRGGMWYSASWYEDDTF